MPTQRALRLALAALLMTTLPAAAMQARCHPLSPYPSYPLDRMQALQAQVGARAWFRAR